MSNVKLFQFKQIRSAWNEKEQKWYFSVQDVVEVFTDSIDVKQYIKKMRSRDAELSANWGTICTLVKMTAAYGKTHIVDLFKNHLNADVDSSEQLKQGFYPTSNTHCEQGI